MKREEIANRLEQLAGLIGVGAILVLIGIPILQALVWLKLGVWPSLPAKDFFGTPRTSWIGVQSLIDAFFDLPLALVGAAFLGLIGGVVLQIAKDFRKPAPNL